MSTKKTNLCVFSTYSCIWLFSVLGGTPGWGIHTSGMITALWSAWLLVNFNIIIIDNLLCVFIVCNVIFWNMCTLWNVQNGANCMCKALTALCVAKVEWLINNRILFIIVWRLLSPVSRFGSFNVWWGLFMGAVLSVFSHGMRDKWNPLASF